MSAQDMQTSETPHEAAQAPTHIAQAEPQAEVQVAQAPTQIAQAESEAEGPAAQAPIQAEGDIAIDDSNSAYSDEL